MSLRVRTALAALMFLSFPLVATWAKPADSQEADTAAIKKLFADFNEAFNKHDAHAVAALYAEDADYINLGAVNSHGRAEVEHHLTPLFAGRLKNAHRNVSLRRIRFLGTDVATVDSDFESIGVLDLTGAVAPSSKGFYDWIVTKQNGRWLITVWHESNVPAPAPPPPAK